MDVFTGRVDKMNYFIVFARMEKFVEVNMLTVGPFLLTKILDGFYVHVYWVNPAECALFFYWEHVAGIWSQLLCLL